MGSTAAPFFSSLCVLLDVCRVGFYRGSGSQVRDIEAPQPQLQGELGPGADPLHVRTAGWSATGEDRQRHRRLGQSSVCRDLRHAGDTEGLREEAHARAVTHPARSLCCIDVSVCRFCEGSMRFLSLSCQARTPHKASHT